MLRLLCRRCISLFKRKHASFVSCWSKTVILLGNDGVSLGNCIRFEDGVSFSCTDGGTITIGTGFYASRGSSLICRGGHLAIDDQVFLGKGVTIVCCDSIEIGAGSLIAEYVVIRDQDHALGSPSIKDAGFETSPVVIGGNVWVGAKASVLRGGEIGDGSVIGAHSLVRDVIPPGVLAVGTPAKIVKRLRAKEQ